MKKLPMYGCQWCPNRSTYNSIDICNKKIDEDGDYKYIKKEEMQIRNEKGELMSCEKYPDWCPLEDY